MMFSFGYGWRVRIFLPFFAEKARRKNRMPGAANGRQASRKDSGGFTRRKPCGDRTVSEPARFWLKRQSAPVFPGEYAKTIADFTQAITTDPKPGAACLLNGLYRGYQT
jgi:hypothetical protein